MTLQNFPQDLDKNSEAWSAIVRAIPFSGYLQDFSAEIAGTKSVYMVTFIIKTADKSRTRYYIGQGDARQRASSHKSEFLRCHTTTKTGKSKLYCAAFLEGATSVEMEFWVHTSGYTTAEAKIVESVVNAELIELHGVEIMLTQPKKPRQI